MIYYLYQISKDSKHSQLTRWEMVEVLKKTPDLSDWLYWTPSEKDWTHADKSSDIKEWIQMSESFLPTPPSLPKNLRSKTQPDPAAERLYGLLIETPSIKDEQQFEVVMDEPKTRPVHAVPPSAVVAESHHTVPTPPPAQVSPQVVKAVMDSAPAPIKDIRKFPRVHGRLRTIITNKAKAFITYSKDISMGGIQLEQAIPPEILKGELEIYVSDPRGKKSLLISCQVVGDNSDNRRFSFSQLESDQSKKLGAWIQELQIKKVS